MLNQFCFDQMNKGSRPKKTTLFLRIVFPNMGGGVSDSQTRSKPLKTPPNHPEYCLFDPNFTFCPGMAMIINTHIMDGEGDSKSKIKQIHHHHHHHHQHQRHAYTFMTIWGVHTPNAHITTIRRHITTISATQKEEPAETTTTTGGPLPTGGAISWTKKQLTRAGGDGGRNRTYIATAPILHTGGNTAITRAM